MDKEWISTPFNFQMFFPKPNPLLHKRGRKTEPPLQHTNFIVWQLQGQHWLCCWCHKQRRWRAVDPAAPGKTVGWKASVSRLGIPWSHLKPWYEGAGYCRVWICVDIEIWLLKTISWSHHVAEKYDNLLSSHVDTFKGSFNSSVPQSVVTRPNGPHQVLAASSNFPTPQAPSWHEAFWNHPTDMGIGISIVPIDHPSSPAQNISKLPSATSFTDSQHEHPPTLRCLLHTQQITTTTNSSSASNQFLWHRS